MKKIKKTILTGLLSLSFMGTVLVFYPQEAKAVCINGHAPLVCNDANGQPWCQVGSGTSSCPLSGIQ